MGILHQVCAPFDEKYHDDNGQVVKKDPPPGNITIYKGSMYIVATRDFANFSVNDDLSRRFLTWLEDTANPDETFMPTLGKLPNAPGYWGVSTTGCRVKFVRWSGQPDDYSHHLPECRGKYVHGICIYQVGYLSFLSKLPDLFVNKFHYDPVTMQCMEELLAYRIQNEPEDYHLIYPRVVKQRHTG